MNSTDHEKLIPAWIELQKTPFKTPRHDELFWSFGAMFHLVASHPQEALDVILEILRVDQSDAVYENLSAGPLEDLLVSHGAEIIDQIEAEAERRADFRLLLGGVWPRDMDRTIWARLKRCRERGGWNGIPTRAGS